MRVTNQTMIRRTLMHLEANAERLMAFQEQIATGKRVNRPSDDPSVAAQVMNYRSTLELQDQHMESIDAALRRLEATELAYGTMTDILQRARELAVRAGSGLLSQDQMQATAAEVEQLLTQAIQVGNTSVGGVYIFGGHQTTAPPFTAVGSPPTAVTYNGDAGLVDMEIAPGLTITANVPGSQGLPAAFTALISLRDNLNAGNAAAVSSTDVPQLGTALEGVLELRGLVGARMNRLERDRENLESTQLAIRGLLSKAEEADLADVVVRLTAQQNVYEASLKASARVVQSTLLDFLR
ncbi:MAG TPA: flagellar hook-associated protein FlgL [Dehalococcoidia bacterium]